MGLFNIFFSERQDLYTDFKSFDTKYNFGILKKLSKINNEENFLSLITEIKFGIFFDNFSHSVNYQNRYDESTPDWTLEINGQKIIAEVVRLNPSYSDKSLLDFENQFMSKIEEIKIGCHLSFDYDTRNKNWNQINFDECKMLLEAWIKQNRNIYDIVILFDHIKVKFLGYKQNFTHTCLSSKGRSIVYNYKRLNAKKSRLVEKSEVYNNIIEKYNLPYIVCIYLDYHTWFRKDDLYQSLYGSCTEHSTEKYYSHLIEKPLYYCSTKIMDNVSGVLLLQNNEFTYFHNYSNTNKLNEKNKDFFLKWQY